MSLTGEDEFTFRAWEQAWEQQRHLESMRSQYLGFFFSIVLGVTALAGPRLAEDSLRTSGDLLTVAALVFGVELLAAFLYISVLRVNQVIGAYTDRIESISTWMRENGAVLDLASFARLSPPSHRWGSTSGSAEFVLRGSLLGIPFLSAAILLRAIDISSPAGVIAACAVGFILTCSGLVPAVRLRPIPRKGSEWR